MSNQDSEHSRILFRKVSEFSPNVPPLLFDEPLQEGIIKRRDSRFTMQVIFNGEVINCHCPATGRIGNFELDGRPCLLSRSKNPNRKTEFTVEAISLNKPSDIQKAWIGINQTAANRYVEHFLTNGLSNMVCGFPILREQKLGDSRLDFLVGNTYVEVKTVLHLLGVDIPAHVKTKKVPPLLTVDRMIKHFTALGNSLQKNQRAILLMCFIHDSHFFDIPIGDDDVSYNKVRKTIDENLAKGVEMWQVNFEITPIGVALKQYFQIQANVVNP